MEKSSKYIPPCRRALGPDQGQGRGQGRGRGQSHSWSQGQGRGQSWSQGQGRGQGRGQSWSQSWSQGRGQGQGKGKGHSQGIGQGSTHDRGQVEHEGKCYTVVTFDGKEYWRRPDMDYVDSLMDQVFHIPFPGSEATYSDHQMLRGSHHLHKVSICTFNASSTRMCFRNFQGLLNREYAEMPVHDRQYIGKTTGDSLEGDDDRRKYVVNYILQKLQDTVIMLLQEIDLRTCEMLEDAGVQIAFSEEADNSNRGGVAIATLNAAVTFVEETCTESVEGKGDALVKRNGIAIVDRWDASPSHKSGSKHVGVFVEATFDGITYNIACFHADKYTKAETIAGYVNKSNSIVGGDFNTNVALLFETLSYSCPLIQRITGDDVVRQDRTIDGIFCT
jgi:hypothetical protein